jgi:hypothetical protein
MHFIETPVFTRLIDKHLDEPSYRALQLALLLRPESGPLIPGSGGLRKVRWARAGGGKRGGLRVARASRVICRGRRFDTSGS